MRARSRFRLPLIIGLALTASWSWAWRSTLFPEDWEAGFRDAEGRFLHDFSYAGYERGERGLPPLSFDPGQIVDVTEPPFLADNGGVVDATRAIQEAIDAIGSRGGGVVFLPPGTYRVRPQTTQDMAALYIDHSGVILRGAGTDQTFLYNSDFSMRNKNVIRLAPPEARLIDYSWTRSQGPTYPLRADVANQATSVLVEGGDFAPGDWIVLRADPTPEFIADHNMTGTWTEEGLLGLTFYRKVTEVGPEPGRLVLDIPLRYPMLRRDNARVTTIIDHIEQVAVENMSISMRSVTFGEMGDDDWDVPGTGAYQVHSSSMIEVNHVVNGWIRRISTYRPNQNWKYHILSNGVRLRFTRSVTVEDVDLQLSQYHGAGGNGIHFSVQGSDLLLTGCSSAEARHNFSTALIVATGNVLHRCSASKAQLPVDFHMHLSPANLIDAMVLDDDSIEATRRDHADHGHSTTQSVIWNARGNTTGWEVDLGIKKLIQTGQFGWGYVIGTSGTDYRIDIERDQSSTPEDFVQGESFGEGLEPVSLYEAQLEIRLGPLRDVRRPSGRRSP